MKAKLSPIAMDQLRRIMRAHGVYGAARKLGIGPTTLLRAESGVAIRSDVAARVSAAVESAS